MKNITIRNFQRTSADEKTVATFDLCLRFSDFEADLCNCRVVKGKNGPFASLPSFKREDQWHQTLRFICPAQKDLNNLVQEELKPYLDDNYSEIPF